MSEEDEESSYPLCCICGEEIKESTSLEVHVFLKSVSITRGTRSTSKLPLLIKPLCSHDFNTTFVRTPNLQYGVQHNHE